MWKCLEKEQLWTEVNRIKEPEQTIEVPVGWWPSAPGELWTSGRSPQVLSVTTAFPVLLRVSVTMRWDSRGKVLKDSERNNHHLLSPDSEAHD